MRIFWIALLFPVCGTSWAGMVDNPSGNWAKTDLDLNVSKIFISNRQCNSTPDYLASCVEAIAAANKHLPLPVAASEDFEKTLQEIAAKLPPTEPAQWMLADAINAHLAHFDAHAFLAPSDTFDTTEPYLGLGVFLHKVRRGFFVTEVIEGTSASRAGMRFGDLIIAVKGLARETFLDLSSKQLGDVFHQSDTVTLSYERNGLVRESELKLTKVDPPNVFSSVLAGEPSIGYIRIRRFVAGHTCLDFKMQLHKLEARGAGKFILDLRSNPGGSTREAVCAAGTFLGFQEVAGLEPVELAIPEKNLIQAADASDGVRWLRGLGVFMDSSPLAILIDGRTGSAAEILAGGLQAQKRAWLVGTRTWGKGTQQTFATLEDHPSLTVAATTERVILPNGLSHQRVGLPPSFNVELTSNPDGNDTLEDDSESEHFQHSLPAHNGAWSDPRAEEISSLERCVREKGDLSPLAVATGGDRQKAYAAAVLKCL